ncbi:MAG: DNA polymerase subunit beta [Promethearchaeota archaeon]|nr:MAG: DNA polymerase subunit beta [Candidatus Lokiarchaeota archaeon]
MSKEKILREHYESITYSDAHWSLFELKRERAKVLLEMFEGLKPYVYGSIARGDVNSNSDIDIIFTRSIPSFQIEFILNKNGFNQYFREIIMATPKDAIKLYIYLSELESITIPITKLDKKVLEFYDFGGKLNLNQLKLRKRSPGIDKRLVLIKPNSQGHEEFSIINKEALAAKELGISIDTIMDRKKVLLKREKHGRTGVFLKRTLNVNESTEAVLKKLADRKSIIRKKLYQK